jgi:hypothetical protein
MGRAMHFSSLVAVVLCAFLATIHDATAFSSVSVDRGCRQRYLGVVKASVDAGDPSDIVARRIIVKGDVHGYYRVCVLNEVSLLERTRDVVVGSNF